MTEYIIHTEITSPDNGVVAKVGDKVTKLDQDENGILVETWNHSASFYVNGENWEASEIYPDTADGAKSYLQSDIDSPLDFSQARVYPDPQVYGVWALENVKYGKGKNSYKTDFIVYLAGYKKPIGGLRLHNDFEECEIIK